MNASGNTTNWDPYEAVSADNLSALFVHTTEINSIIQTALIFVNTSIKFKVNSLFGCGGNEGKEKKIIV